MLVLLMIVVLSVLALWLSNMERKHPAALIMVGLVSVALGGRVVALMSGSYADQYLGTVCAEEEYPPVATPVDGNDAKPTATAVDADSSESVTVTEDTTPVAATSEPRELTVEPTPSFRYLTLPRPDWLETEASKRDDLYQVAVESGLHVRKRTAHQNLQDEIRATVDAYVNDYLESQLASTLTGYSIVESENAGVRTITMHLDGDVFELARERFDEQVEFDYGVMNQSHALINIDKNIQKKLDQRWSKVRATSRLFQTGLGAGALLLLLGTTFSYLKLDTATRGYYTGRLQFGAAGAILAIIAAGVVFARWIPWM